MGHIILHINMYKRRLNSDNSNIIYFRTHIVMFTVTQNDVCDPLV